MIESEMPSVFLHREVVGGHSPSLYPLIDTVKIKGFLKSSLVDWDGYITVVIFLPLCNFRCPMCHNHEIVLKPENYPDVSKEEIERYILDNRDFVDGVVITGGEPTLHKGLSNLCKWFKDMGIMVKLDTNGAYPERLEYLMDNGLIDYIAMDIKAPLNEEEYGRVSGCKVNIDKIRRSIDIIMKSGVDYEFRTTVVPAFHNDEDIIEIAQDIKGARLFVLQQFNPSNTLDPNLKDITPYSKEKLEEIAKKCKPFVSNIKIRA